MQLTTLCSVHQRVPAAHIAKGWIGPELKEQRDQANVPVGSGTMSADAPRYRLGMKK